MIRTLLLVAALSMAGAARAEVVRHPIPNSTFPIAQAVEVKGPVTTSINEKPRRVRKAAMLMNGKY